jgi:AraC-like DNA-binding protein
MTQSGILENNLLKSNRKRTDTAVSLELRMDNIYIWHILPKQDQSKRFDFQGNESYIQMVFSLDSLKDYHGGNVDHVSYDLHPEQNDLIFIPKNCKDFSTVKISAERELFGINISTELLLKVLPDKSPMLGTIKKAIINQKLVFVKSNNRILSIGMRQVIEQIIRCMREDHYKYIYYQAKVFELLSLQFVQIETSVNESQLLKEDELKRVYRVKAILEQNPENNYTLLGLAHTVGTNDSTLKKHFKMVFGITVFDYLNAYRMEMAKKILLEQDSKVAVIAGQFGYKHATHFSAAFKKYFGYPPTKLKITGS